MSQSPTLRAQMIGLQINSLRREACLTQAELAAAIVNAAAEDGVTVTLDSSAVSHWEAGRFEPALRYRRYIADIFGVPVRNLFPNISRNEAA